MYKEDTDGQEMKHSQIRKKKLKVALITGGASGLGESTARLFLKHGAKVLIADVQDELGQSLRKELGTLDIITYIHCDVTCEMNVQNAVDLAVSRYGKLDIMFNNAGISGVGGLRAIDSDGDSFKKVLDVNVVGGFFGAKLAAQVIVPVRKGCILFTASVASLLCVSVAHAYTTSKHAIVGLAKSLSVELGEYGIRVNCISPHAVATPMLLNWLVTSEKRKIEEIVLRNGVLKGTILEAADIAQAALFLASDEAKYVSGVNLPVDGAYTVNNQTWKIGLMEAFIVE
ncbi:secoisolariciresinol dehydrogenase-like [Gossypium australe]|uniref:Secoisolariciresinol dehydrogenase-like n=1 Tax=Gossypium australe TaxID=47621 RepID=A0A5B6V7S4_9ROSI|nr:secoisolariciresinol dehydrogenase-like [Gossypium australe]